MLRKSIIVILILLILIFVNINYAKDESIANSYEKNMYYGYLIIPSIDINLGFYDYDNPLNNVDLNIELIDTKIDNTYLLAGHSGIGKNAFFNNLKDIQINDDVYLEIAGIINHYKVINIKKEIKDGSISINRLQDQIILTTCDQIIKGYQLIVEGTLVFD